MAVRAEDSTAAAAFQLSAKRQSLLDGQVHLRKELAEGQQTTQRSSPSPRSPFKKVNHLKSIDQSLEKINASRKQKQEMRKLDRKAFEHKMTNMKQELHEKLLAKGKAKPTMVAFDFWDNKLQAKVGKIYSETKTAQVAGLDVFVRLEEIYGLIENEKQTADLRKLAGKHSYSDVALPQETSLLSPTKNQDEAVQKISDARHSMSLPKINLPNQTKPALLVESSSRSIMHSRVNSNVRRAEESLPPIKESANERKSISKDSSYTVQKRPEAIKSNAASYLLQVASQHDSPIPSPRNTLVPVVPATLSPQKGKSVLFTEASNLNSKRQSALQASATGKDLSNEKTDLTEKKKSLHNPFNHSGSELTGLAENHRHSISLGKTELVPSTAKRLSIRKSRKSVEVYEKPQTPRKKDILDNPFGFLTKFGAESLNASVFNESSSVVRGKSSLVEESKLISREKGEDEVQGFLRASKWIVETCDQTVGRPAMRTRLDVLREGFEAYNKRSKLNLRRRAGTKEDAYNIEYLKTIFARKKRTFEGGSFNL